MVGLRAREMELDTIESTTRLKIIGCGGSKG